MPRRQGAFGVGMSEWGLQMGGGNKQRGPYAKIHITRSFLTDLSSRTLSSKDELAFASILQRIQLRLDVRRRAG